MLEERREGESNPRIGLLQSPALPLGYPAVFVKACEVMENAVGVNRGVRAKMRR